MMDPEAIRNSLDELRENAPGEQQEYFLSFEDLWERKLWHELTNKLLEYFRIPDTQRLALFKQFVVHFAEKINQLKLVQLGLDAAETCQDDQQRLQFLTELSEKVNKPSSQDAYVYAKAAVASIKLRLDDQAGARADLDQCETILDTFDSVENVVHAAFYRVNGDYYQAKHEFAPYYKNALLYLACIDESELAPPDRERRAYDLSIAALVSDSIYNFGELLLHPILDSLKAPSPHAWLRELLFAFNRGDLGAYDVLAGNISKNALLHEHQTFLYQKVSLAALTEAVFKRPPHDRAMTFSTITHETKVQPDEIEHLIMKALSLGLLHGTIDQVDAIANFTWVQPKVLDMAQIDSLRVRLREWDQSVNHLGTWIESAGKDVWAA